MGENPPREIIMCIFRKARQAIMGIPTDNWKTIIGILRDVRLKGHRQKRERLRTELYFVIVS